MPKENHVPKQLDAKVLNQLANAEKIDLESPTTRYHPLLSQLTIAVQKELCSS